jgi:putative spermidine/putrescine transport system permease protein
LMLSVKAALGATLLALVLGTLASLAVARYRFFGRETISFLVILPIALPGIVTGMALNATFNTAGVTLGLVTIIVGHATFCTTTTRSRVCGGRRNTSKRPPPTSEPTPGRPSAT